MRNPLNKRLPREFKKNSGKYIGMFLILVITIMVGSSFMATLDSATATLNENDVLCKTENGQFETKEPVSDKLIKQLRKKDITVIPNYYSSINNYDGNATLLVFDERTKVNLPSIFEGKLPANNDEVAIERIFAQNRGISIGDKITLYNNKFKVTAIIALPDYSSLFKNNSDLLMNNSDFGLCIVNKDGFAKFSDDTITYRYSYLIDDESANETTKREIAEDIQKALLEDDATLQSFLTAENNQSICFLKEDMGKDGPFMRVFIYILIIIIAFVFAILTNNTIESESTIIGTLRALGYKKSEIIAHYLSPIAIIALVSSVIGNIAGYTVMINPFKEMYYSNYAIAPINIQFNLEAFVLTTILPVVIMILINWFMLYNKLSLSPLKFLRKDLNKRKQKRAIKLPAFSFLSRFRLRVLLQNKSSYLILFIGVFISSFLLMFGIGLGPLIDHYVDEVDDSISYEYQYILKEPIEIENAEKLQTYSLKTYYKLGKTDISVSFMGISDDSKYFEDIALHQDKNHITVTKPLAEKLNLDIGDEIIFKDDYFDKEYTLTVSDIYDYKGTLSVFMKRENLNKLLEYDVNSFNSYLSDQKLNIDDNHITKMITRSDLVGATDQMMESFNSVIKFINIFSVGVYVILMYILTKTVLEKNSLSISFMKVFGYNSSEIGKIYLHPTTLTVFVSLFICIPLEVFLFKYLLVYIASMIEGYISFYLPVWVYITIIATGIIAYLVINTILVKKVKNIPMNEALKNRE